MSSGKCESVLGCAWCGSPIALVGDPVPPYKYCAAPAKCADHAAWEASGAAPAQAMRFDAGKVGVHLLPTRPLEAVARVLDFGARKYAANNWRKGMAYSRVYGPMLRHAWKWWRGEDYDTPTGEAFKAGDTGPVDDNGKPIFSGEHHLACVACNALFLLEYCLNQEKRRAACDDRAHNDQPDAT